MKKKTLTFSEEKIIISKHSGIHMISYSEIMAFVYDAPYISIILHNKNNKLISYSLKDLTQKLPPYFVLCNRAAIINLKYILSVNSKNGKPVLCLKNGHSTEISRRKKKDVIARIKALHTLGYTI